MTGVSNATCGVGKAFLFLAMITFIPTLNAYESRSNPRTQQAQVKSYIDFRIVIPKHLNTIRLYPNEKIKLAKDELLACSSQQPQQPAKSCVLMQL